MKKESGYPLPAGVLGGDEIVCQLVYLPNRPEYWQALLAGIHYFSTWRAWERDTGKRGRDAAANWRAAFELTMGCWRMTCLEQLQDDVANIFVLLRDRKDCCDDNITYGPQTEVETEIEPEVGDPPDYYGETAVADWEDWYEHVCLNAHLYVDHLVWQAEELNTLLALGGIGIGLLGAALVLLSFAGVGLAVTYALVAATAAGILELGSLGVFLTTADDIEDARNDLVCSLMQGTSLRQAVEDALGSASLDWLSFFSVVDYESATAIIYEGGFGSEYLDSGTRDDCLCPGDYGQDEYGFWPSGYYDDWETVTLVNVIWDVWEGLGGGGGPPGDYRLQFLRSGYPDIFGITNVTSRTIRIEFDYMFYTGGSAEVSDFNLRVEVLSSTSPWTYILGWEQFSTGAGGTWDEWHHAVIVDASLPDVLCTLSTKRPFYFSFGRTSTKLNRRMRIKNVQVWTSHT